MRVLPVPVRLLGDERLAQEVGLGHDGAFAELFKRYHQQLYRYCRSLTSSDQDAQDALQSAFANALVALRHGRRNAPIRPWLYRIAHNESISLVRGRMLTSELPEDMQSYGGVHETVEEQERLAKLVADLQELPERQRAALVMRELSGLSHEDIAQALELTVGAAKQTILEARRSLMEFEEGRTMACDQVQRMLSEADGRSLRSRRVRAHLRACPSCSAFAQAIPRRRADMLALWPMLPAASGAGLLAKLTGAGSGHGGGGGATTLAAGTAAKGVAATVSVKAAAVAGAAVVAVATVGAVKVLHHASPRSPAAVVHTQLSRGQAQAASHRVNVGAVKLTHAASRAQTHSSAGNPTALGQAGHRSQAGANDRSAGANGRRAGANGARSGAHGHRHQATHGTHAAAGVHAATHANHGVQAHGTPVGSTHSSSHSTAHHSGTSQGAIKHTGTQGSSKNTSGGAGTGSAAGGGKTSAGGTSNGGVASHSGGTASGGTSNGGTTNGNGTVKTTGSTIQPTSSTTVATGGSQTLTAGATVTDTSGTSSTTAGGAHGNGAGSTGN